jgi:CAAX protease family protein
MSDHGTEARATTRTGAWTWVGVLVALGGPTLVVAAKRAGCFGSEVGGGHIFDWLAMWGVTLLTVLVLVVGERRPLSTIGFRRLTWASLGFGVALGAVVIMTFPLASLILKALNIPNPQTALAEVATMPLWVRLGTLLTAGVTEEILFRGYPISRLKVATGSTAIAVAIPFGVFVLLHLPSWGVAHLLFVSVAAALFTLAFVWRRNLWANIIAHVVTDSVPLLILPLTGMPPG